MSFDVAASAYDQFMGRWSGPLGDLTVARLGLRPGAKVLDVGCGPGALTERLVAQVGVANVSAVEPMQAFVAAVKERLPGVDVRTSPAEELPFDDATFDVTVAQLVILFMKDSAAGVAEMRRVTRPGGLVAFSVWDHGSGTGPLSPFWTAVHSFEPDHPGEAQLHGTHRGDLEEIASAAGLTDVVGDVLTVTLRFETFEDWWNPFTLGVGPAGDYVRGLHERGVIALRERCRDQLGPAPFSLSASAWYAEGHA